MPVAHFLFGITYMVYGTFIVTTMVEELSFPEARAGLFCAGVGFFSIFPGVGFGLLSDRFSRRGGLAAVFLVQTASCLVSIRKLRMDTEAFLIQKRAIFRKVKEIKVWRGGVHRYAAQASPPIDEEIAEKGRFRTETIWPPPHSPPSPSFSQSRCPVLAHAGDWLPSGQLSKRPLVETHSCFVRMESKSTEPVSLMLE